MALSHCWGPTPGTQIPTTTTINIDTYFDHIPIASLPKTFQDAILLTRKLGVRYLWIDSLCIIQDSTEDWDREASMMGEIYWNSHLTLAASSAANATEGLFRKRDRRKISPCILTWPSEGDETAHRIIIQPPLPYMATALGKDPLGNRAWTLQEQDLSPRVIHFSTNQLYWQCRGCIASEEVPGMLFKSSANLRHTMVRSRIFDIILYMDDVSMTAWVIAWYDMVRIYSQRRMTFAKDKLPAISGIAQKLRSITKDSYVAGHWKSDMIRGMMWFGTDDSLGLKRAANYRAPSWSWASVDGPLEWPLTQFSEAQDRHRPSVMHIKLHIAGYDNTGRVSGGLIVLRGLVITVVNARLKGSVPAIVYTRQRWIHLSLIAYADGLPFGTVRLDDGADGDLDAFLIIKMFEEKAQAGGEGFITHALALAPAAEKPGYTRRIGTVTISPRGQNLFDDDDAMNVVIV